MHKPKKSLGQNFLRDEQILDRIIKSANLNTEDKVIEIGPGEGVLTDRLLQYAKKIICIEKDNLLVNNLRVKYKSSRKIDIINDDILKINLPRLIEQNGFEDYKLIANIPYYITSPIIRLFLETQHQPQEMILMVQREVAKRICAIVGQMSILAVSVQYYAKVEILFDVDKTSFWPVPEVDSAVIKIVPTKKNFPKKESQHFFKLVKAGFSAKRKTLSNNLSTSLHLDKKEVEEKLEKIDLKPNVRAQELSVADWKKLAESFN